MLLTPAQVAARLAVSKSQVFRYIESGKLKARRLSPRVIRVHADDLKALVNDAA